MLASQTGRRIADLLQGLRLVGLQSLECHLMDLAKRGVRGLDPGWSTLLGDRLEHGHQVAWCSYLIALETAYRQPSEAYMAGFLHDVGIGLLQAHPLSELVLPLGLTVSEAETIVAADDRPLGGNHAYVGAKFLERSQLSPVLTTAIANHHAPERALGAQKLARIVYVAEHFTSRASGEPALEGDDSLEGVLARLNLTPEQALRLAERALEHTQRLARERDP